MRSCRLQTALPRVCKPSKVPTRTLATLFPRFPSAFSQDFANDFAPLIRALDSPSSLFDNNNISHPLARRAFAPKFDVREKAAAYELQGELPGIKQEDVDIEFVDANTLVIRGRSVSEETRRGDAEGAIADAEVPPITTANEAAETSSSIQDRRATVEDDYVDAGASSSSGAENDTSVASTPTSSTTEVAPTQNSTTTIEKPQEPIYKYWVSERSTGEFQRSFTFPGRLDQEAVRASLKNGILSVVVPKVIREGRRIVVE